MHRHRLLRGLALALAIGAVVALQARAEEDDVRKGPQILAAAEHGVGQPVPDLAFTDLDGTPGRLSDYKGKQALVIAFTNVGCPVCKRYAPSLAALSTTYDPNDVAVLLVNPSPQDDDEAIRASNEARGLTARYVPDRERKLARVLAATSTAEVFLLDAARTLVYRGALDDQFGVGYALDAPRRTYLADAVRALLAGGTPPVQATTAPGCLLRLDAQPAKDAGVTYHAQVARIVERRCAECHRPGENGPFSLLTYEDVKGNADMIRWAVEERRMPPWFAGEGSLAFANDRSLSASERADVLAWIDAGCPEGDPADAPPARTWPQGWKIGEPDAVLQIPRPFRVPAAGTVAYQYQTVSTDFGEDRWIQAMEVRPTAPEVVHHALVFIKYPADHPRAREQPRVRGGLSGYFAAMVPGQGAFTFPAGTAKFLPEGAQLRFQIHYTANGTETADQTQLGLIFAKEAPRHRMRSLGVYNTRFRIPPGAPNHAVSGGHYFTRDARIYGFTPHMHVRGKAFRYELLLPDGERKILLDIPRYDFNWQLYYHLKEPLDIPYGSRLRVTGWFDNSEANPANPDPTASVRFGEQTWEEMMIGYVDWHPSK